MKSQLALTFAAWLEFSRQLIEFSNLPFLSKWVDDALPIVKFQAKKFVSKPPTSGSDLELLYGRIMERAHCP